MNIDDCIRAHTDWKAKLQLYIDKKSTERLEPSMICLDNRCALGQWIYAEGAKEWGGEAIYPELKSAHASFHKAAAKIVEAANSGDAEKAKLMVSAIDGDFTKTTRNVVHCLMVLRKGHS